ncbi:MAG: hypothetical protein ACRDYY_06745 [Acidimicrobiales bacterium]
MQGVYAFTGIVRFWDIQRQLESEPDAILRANVLYERWRLAIDLVADTLLGSGTLTARGTDFVTVLRQHQRREESQPVPTEAVEIAREVALDDWLTWQLTHTALDAAGVARLAAAYQHGEPLVGLELPATWVEDDIRKIDSIPRSRLLNMRFQDPGRYRQLSATGVPGLGAADALLVRGDSDAAAAAYRTHLVAEPDPAAWIGLALAVHRRAATPTRSVLAAYLPLLFEMHAYLAERGFHADALELAAWFE